MIVNILEKIKQTDRFILFIYFYFFLMPWNFEKWQMGVLTVVMFIWWVIKYKSQLKEKLKTIFEFKPLVILIVFIAYTYISTLWSDSISDGFDHVNKFSKYYIFMIPVLFTSLKYEEAINSIKVIIASFGLYSLFSILIYLGIFTISETGSDSSNPKGLMAYAIVSAYMAIGTLAAFIMYKSDYKYKYLFLSISILCLVALFVNNSRTSQLSFLLTLITLSVLYFRIQIFKPKIFLITLSVLAIVVSSMYFVLENNGKLKRYNIAFNEAVEAFHQNKYGGSFGVRVYFNVVGLEIFYDNLLFGIGPEDNIEKLHEYMIRDQDKLSTNIIYSSFHSQHMDILTRYGLVGYLLLFLSVITLIYSLRKITYIYWIGVSFFVTTFYISLANVMLIKKPFNYIFISMFVLLSVISYLKQKETNVEPN